MIIIIVNQQSSKTFNLNYGVPQGSCLESALFLLYASRLFEVVKKLLPSLQRYVDDTWLYVSFHPDSFAAQEQAIKAIEIWLMFNDSKTQFLVIGSWQQLSKVTIASIKVETATFNPLSMLETLAHGLITMSMSSHIRKMCSKAFRELYNIRQIRKYLSVESTMHLLHHI